MTAPQEREFLLRQVEAAVRMGDIARASALARQAVDAGIEHPGLLNLLAHDEIERGGFDRAVALLERARALAPRDAHVLNTLGIVLKRMGRPRDAAEAFDAAIAAAPAYANAHFNKGGVLESLDANDEAEAAYRRAVELEPRFAEALGRLSYLAAVRGDYDAALDFAQRATALRPSAVTAEMHLAQLAHLRGDHEAAVRLAQRAMERDPSNLSIVLLLAAAEIATGKTDSAAGRLAPLLQRTPHDGDDSRLLALGLMGRIEEQRGNFPAAFAAFSQSKKELRHLHAASYTTPEGTQYAARVARVLRYFREAPAENGVARPRTAPPAQGAPRTHVFLVGFPRSGTTLLEKSLAGHPDIVTMEEEELFASMIGDFFVPQDGFERLARLEGAALEGYRAAYWQICRAAAPGLEGKVFVDKMPLNTVFLSCVAKLFPDARVLFALRDPRDVVLSCLRQQFAMSAAMYEFTSLESAARLYDMVMELGEIYRAKLGLAIMDTRYEDMIADVDGALRRIAGFLGVEWNDAMREAAASARARPIRTPSAPQIARGLYDGSGQWRRYRDEMAPVLPLLAKWVARFRYPAD